VGDKMKKVKLVLLLSIFIFSVSPVYSQDTPKTDSLSFDRAFDFFFINGYALGYKFKLNENSALRLTLDLRGTYLNSDGESDSRSSYPYDTVSNKYNTEGESNNVNIAFSGTYLYYLLCTKYVSIYAGSGPYFSYNNYFYKNTSDYEGMEILYTNTNKNSGFSIGLLSLFGVSGALNENVNLFAEAQLFTLYQWTNSKYERTESNQGAEVSRQINENSSNGWSLEFSVVRVGMSLCF
jgi:hypothetical protein